MNLYLQPSGFLGTGASLLADLTLLAYILLIVPGMIAGYIFARRGKHRPHHKRMMITITIVNWVLIIFLMLVAYRYDVVGNLPLKPTNPRYLLPTIHGILGLTAQLLATYVVYRMVKEDYQVKRAKARGEKNLSQYWFKNAKRPMQLVLVLWLATSLLGVFNYLIRYNIIPPALARAPAPVPAATIEVNPPQATQEASAAAPVQTAEVTPGTPPALVVTAEVTSATAAPPVATSEVKFATAAAPVATAEVTSATAAPPVQTAEVRSLPAVVTAQAPVSTAEISPPAPVQTAEAPVSTAEVSTATPPAPAQTAEVPPVVTTAEAPVETAEVPPVVVTAEAPTPPAPVSTAEVVTATPPAPASTPEIISLPPGSVARFIQHFMQLLFTPKTAVPPLSTPEVSAPVATVEPIG